MAEFSATVVDESAVGAVCSCMRCKSDRYDSISKLNHHRAKIIERWRSALQEIANGGNAVFSKWESTGPKTREQMAYIAREALLHPVGSEEAND